MQFLLSCVVLILFSFTLWWLFLWVVIEVCSLFLPFWIWKCCWISGWSESWIFPTCEYDQLCGWDPCGSCLSETVGKCVYLWKTVLHNSLIPWRVGTVQWCIPGVKVGCEEGGGSQSGQNCHIREVLSIALNFLFTNKWKSTEALGIQCGLMHLLEEEGNGWGWSK